MTIKISALPALAAPATSLDLVALVDDLDATTKKATIGELLDFVIAQANTWALLQTFLTSPHSPFGTGVRNERFGEGAGRAAATGGDNLTMGYHAGNALTSGEFNCLLGSATGQAMNSGSGNMCLGYFAGQSLTSGGANCLIGKNAGAYLTTHGGNCFIGNSAGGGATCDDTVAIGNSAGQSNNSVGCVFLGSYAGYSSTSTFSVMIGYGAGQNNSGDMNVYAGFLAGKNGTGNHNTYLGAFADDGAAINYAIALGVNAVPTANNEMAISPYTDTVTFHHLSSTAVDVPWWKIAINVVSNTHASRKYNVRFYGRDTADRLAFEFGGNGTAAVIGAFGAAPVVQPVAVGSVAGYTANVTLNFVYDASTFTGAIGANAYTIDDIVFALKKLGWLAT